MTTATAARPSTDVLPPSPALDQLRTEMDDCRERWQAAQARAAALPDEHRTLERRLLEASTEAQRDKARAALLSVNARIAAAPDEVALFAGEYADALIRWGADVLRRAEATRRASIREENEMGKALPVAHEGMSHGSRELLTSVGTAMRPQQERCRAAERLAHDVAHQLRRRFGDDAVSGDTLVRGRIKQGRERWLARIRAEVKEQLRA